jgi:hypothetical protein
VRKKWVKPLGKRALLYGPQAQLVWRYAGRPATAAAQRAVLAAQARRTALRHADTVVEGAIVKAFDQGEVHWVVFSAGTPVASYPPATGELSSLVAHADLSKKMTPDQFRERRAGRTRRRRALAAASEMRSHLRQRRDSW